MLPLTSWAAVNGFSPFLLIPENPVEGENVQLYYLGCEVPSPNIATGEYFYLEQNGNLTNVVISMGFGVPTCPIDFEYYYDLGVYLEGNYQLEVYVMLSSTPFPIDTSLIPPTESRIFIVTGAPTPVPAFNLLSFMMLCILFGLATLIKLKRNSK